MQLGHDNDKESMRQFSAKLPLNILQCWYIGIRRPMMIEQAKAISIGTIFLNMDSKNCWWWVITIVSDKISESLQDYSDNDHGCTLYCRTANFRVRKYSRISRNPQIFHAREFFLLFTVLEQVKSCGSISCLINTEPLELLRLQPSELIASESVWEIVMEHQSATAWFTIFSLFCQLYIIFFLLCVTDIKLKCGRSMTV